MPSPLLNPDLTFNFSAITRSAWASARADVAKCRRYGVATMLRQAFAEALRRQWDIAKGSRANAIFFAERDAEDARRRMLPELERRVLVLREARDLACFTDSTREMIRVQGAIDAQLAHIRAAA